MRQRQYPHFQVDEPLSEGPIIRVVRPVTPRAPVVARPQPERFAVD